MVSLIDLGPSFETIDLRGKSINVSGLSAEDIMMIMRDFPELRMMMVERQLDEANITSALMRLPRVVGMICAAATGMGGDEPTIAYASAMPAGEQFAIVQAALRQTFPRGIKSFMDGLTDALQQAAPQGALGRDQDTKSPEQSSAA